MINELEVVIQDSLDYEINHVQDSYIVRERTNEEIDGVLFENYTVIPYESEFDRYIRTKERTGYQVIDRLNHESNIFITIARIN